MVNKLEMPSRRQFVKVTLLSWLAVLGFDFFLHGGLLAHLYTVPSPFLLEPRQAFMRIPLGYIGFLLFTSLTVWLMIKLNLRNKIAGLRFGLLFGGLIWGAQTLGLLSISTASLPLMGGWFIGQTIESGLAGFIAGLGLDPHFNGRLWLIVLLLDVVMITGTIALQSTGLAPAAQTIR